MSKQTAVEWLAQEIINFYASVSIYKTKQEIIEQAKEMGKQQTIDAFNEGYRIGNSDAETFDGDIANYSDASLYYKNTFNK